MEKKEGGTMNRLKKLRVDNSLTLKKLASELNKLYNLNISDGQLSNYENGKRQPRSQEFWEKLADYFDVSISYIMGLSDSAESATNVHKEINVLTDKAKNENFKNPETEEKFWNLLFKMSEIEKKDSPFKSDVIQEINFSNMAPDSYFLLFAFQQLDDNNQKKLLDYLYLLNKSQDFDELLNSLTESEQNNN